MQPEFSQEFFVYLNSKWEFVEGCRVGPERAEWFPGITESASPLALDIARILGSAITLLENYFRY